LGKLRVLSGVEACKILEAHGFIAVRQRGSHRILQLQAEGATITVPVPLHDPLLRGTLQSIIRQSGLDKTLFECELAATMTAKARSPRRLTGFFI